ncbi:MAG: phosphodiester glycosidase family protein [Cyanobacteria bacterium P01_D01_bin.105]
MAETNAGKAAPFIDSIHNESAFNESAFNESAFNESAFNESVYQSYELDNATVHVVSVPAFAPLSVAIADELMTVGEFANELTQLGTPPQAIINAGFFDPNNGKTTSHITIDAERVGYPADNEGLTGNPKLQPYLLQILNRSEFRVYDCSLANRLTPYAITAHNAPVPKDCDLVQSIGAGPQLLPADTSEAEAFTQFDNGELVRDAIGSVYPNARSAIGIKADGSAMLLMVAQRPNASGLTLAEVANFADSLGVTQLLNLDGGSSASMYYNGELYLGRLDSAGEKIERPVKSVIVLEERR